MAILIKQTPKKDEKKKGAKSGDNITRTAGLQSSTQKTQARTKTTAVVDGDISDEIASEGHNTKKDKASKIDFSKLFMDVNNTIRATGAYIDSEGDLIMCVNVDASKIVTCEPSEANFALVEAEWELRPDIPETDENKSTITRTRITIESDMIDIAETTLGAWTAHVKNIAGINDILPSKRTYYSLATGQQLESGIGKGIDYKRRYMSKPENKELAIKKLKDIIKANPKAGKDIEWFI